MDKDLKLENNPNSGNEYRNLDRPSGAPPTQGGPATERRVLTQKREYADSTAGAGNGESQAQPSGRPPRKGGGGGDGSGKKSINPKLLVAAAIGLVVLIIIGMLIGSSFKKRKAEEDARHAEELLMEQEEQQFAYTDVQKEALRLAGFTGDEIEKMEFEEKDADAVVKEEKAKRKKIYEEEVKPYFEGASDEFKEVYADTWYGQKDIKVDSDKDSYQYFDETINVDYEKLPAKGHQLFIKFYLSNGDACFMTVTPERYLTLKDAGNIVIKMKYTQMGNGTRIITYLQEVIPQ